MTDRFIFVVSPYLTAAASVPGCLVRYVVWSRRGGDRAGHSGSGPIRSAWRWAIGVVAAGHLFAFAFPEIILRWNQQPIRLLVLEGTGLTAGAVALAALIAMGVRCARASAVETTCSPFDVIASTLVLTELLSGLAVAVFYRWGSSWSAVTVAPYLRSLLTLDPSTVLVARLPLAARLHLFCAFALLAVIPFSRLARVVIVPVDRLARWIVERRSSLALRSWIGFDDWSARVQPLRIRLTRHDGEEN